MAVTVDQHNSLTVYDLWFSREMHELYATYIDAEVLFSFFSLLENTVSLWENVAPGPLKNKIEPSTCLEGHKNKAGTRRSQKEEQTPALGMVSLIWREVSVPFVR